MITFQWFFAISEGETKHMDFLQKDFKHMVWIANTLSAAFKVFML